MGNIQHSTYNAQRRRAACSRVTVQWMLNVECWALNVSPSFNFRILFLLFVPLIVHAQLPQQLPPGVAVQMMQPQPAVDVSQSENFSATAAFDPPVVRVGEKTFYRVTVEATQNSIQWSDDISAPPELKFGANVRGQIARVEGNKFHPLTAFAYEVTATAAGRFTVPAFNVPSGWLPVENIFQVWQGNWGQGGDQYSITRYSLLWLCHDGYS